MASDDKRTEAHPYKDEIVISWPELHRDARYLSHVLHQKGDWVVWLPPQKPDG